MQEEANLLKMALLYQKQGFSVIPIRDNKKPYIKWEKYQTERASSNQIKKWWKQWPDANIGIVTGKVSGVDVVDVDSEKGRDALNEYLPDALVTPISKTPKGYHYFFKHRPGLANGVRVIADCDLRTTGGYVIVPPSMNDQGNAYAWLPGLSIAEVESAAMPEMLFDILKNADYANASSSEHINGINPIRTCSLYKGITNHNITRLTNHNKHNISFEQGCRDDSLFHIANCLVKGNMEKNNILKCLYFFGSNCNPPFPEKEILAKVESSFKRIENQKRNLTAEVREWVNITWHNISITDALQNITNITNTDRPKITVIMNRLVKEGILERVANQYGVYRKIQDNCEPEDWQNASTDTVNLWLPFGLNEMISIMPGSIILFAGAQDAGKSAVQMNIAKENRFNWNVHYFSSELNAGAFKNRMNKFPDLALDQCSIKFYQHSSNFHDVLKTGKNDLNIIDYLEIHDAFYKVSEYLARIHEKLGDAICIVALQKDPNALYGRGGSFTQEKPILSVALDHGRATISKFKGEFKGENPRGKEYRFKLVDGCNFTKVEGWHRSPKT